MTREGAKHQGQAFFPLPDGSALLYSLEGTADPPAAAGTISMEVPARRRQQILLPVSAQC
jgi:hydrocephalus-inducing protein